MAERLLPLGAVDHFGRRMVIGHLRIRSIDRRAQHSEFFGDRNSLRRGANVQLLHDALAMRLHGALRGPKVVGDLLVELPANDQGKEPRSPSLWRGEDCAIPHAVRAALGWDQYGPLQILGRTSY